MPPVRLREGASFIPKYPATRLLFSRLLGVVRVPWRARLDQWHLKGAWVAEQKVDVERREIVAFRVTLKISFVVD